MKTLIDIAKTVWSAEFLAVAGAVVATTSALLGRRAWRLLALVALLPIAWWLALDLSGGFTNASGSGDNLGAYGFVAMSIVLLLGAAATVVGAAVGAGIRRWARNDEPRPRRR